MAEPSVEQLQQIFGSYMAWKLDPQTWIISFMNGTEYMYLLEGRDKALLLDTGYGAGNLRAFVEGLTDRPVIVANTHFHPDHAGGNGEFEQVYMSEGAAIDAPSVTLPGAVPFDLSSLPHPDYEKRYLKNGDTLELGGRTVEVVGVKPAHCNSSLFYLDRGHRMFFTGDELEAGQVMMFDNSKNPDAPYEVRSRLENMRDNCMAIKALESDFDYLLPNHNGTPIAKTYVDEFSELADAIFRGEAVMEDRLHHPFVEMEEYAKELCRVRWKRISIFIKKKEVMKVYGRGPA